MKNISYITIVIVLIALAAGVLYVSKEETPSNIAGKTDTVSPEEIESTEYWIDNIEELGGEDAYEKFKTANNAYNVNDQHTNAHIFGSALFGALGLDGTTVCDLSFSFGCYHEYLGQAIHAHGIESVNELNEVCVENLGPQALSCQHGIGHGIQSYFGYEEPDLLNGLGICSELPYSDPIGGCYGGLFMEYNMRTMLSLDGVGARDPRDVNNLHEPCDQVEDDQRPACYYWQPQWWFSVLHGHGSTDMEAFEEMGTLCRELDDPGVIRECFEGIGNIVPQSSNYEPAETISFCQAAAKSEAEEIYCRSDAANSFHAIPSVREKAPLVCEGFEGEALEFCIGHSTNAFNQLNAPPSIEGVNSFRQR